jgi:hypothetical protein
MNETDFADKENWLGSHYELYIDYPLATDEAYLVKAMHAVWAMPSLHGPYVGPYNGHGEALHPVTLPEMLDPVEATHMYGVLELPEGTFVGCCLIASRTDSGKWFGFYIPAGMLALVYQLDYTFQLESNPWMEEIDQALLDIAQEIYVAAPFALAAIGEEAFVGPSGADLTVDKLDKGTYILSPSLFEKLRPPSEWVVLRTGLRWHPQEPGRRIG